MIESGPIPAVHGVVRWRLVDLCQWIFEEFRITVAKQTLSRELRAMGYRKLSAGPLPWSRRATGLACKPAFNFLLTSTRHSGQRSATQSEAFSLETSTTVVRDS
jgi:hypothetical protein